LAIDDYYSVGSENAIIGTLTGYCLRLFAGQALGAGFRGFSGYRVFENVGGLHFKRNASVAQQFLATR
jgi:hypothetical protein